ncbi:MAG: dockerin type I domain-containing protein [Candidatus Hydrogenedentota bacterium]
MYCVIIGICVAAASASLPLPWPGAEPVAGDVNGDGTVDIRDLQVVIAAVFSGGAPSAADVNSDGTVDVRDYQFLLARTRDPGARAPLPAPPHTGERATPPLPAPTLCPPRSITAPTPAAPHRARGGAGRQERAAVVHAARCARYVYNLTPHAPPA